MKLSNLSLKWRLFFTICLFSLVIILIFVLFQIALLAPIYRNRKIRMTSKLLNEVKQVCETSSINDYTLNKDNSDVLKTISLLSDESDVNIYILDVNDFENPAFMYEARTASHNKLDFSVLKDICKKAKEQDFLEKDFFSVVFNAPEPVGIVNLFSIDAKKELRKNLSKKSTGVLGCCFITLEDNSNCLIVLDNKLIPVEEVVNTMRMQLVFISIIVVLLTGIIAILLSKYISKPIAVLNENAKKLSKGDYNVDFLGNAYLEINELSDTLNIASKELSKTETLRRELMANVSHDLKTPLTMIMGYAELMKDIPEEKTDNNLQVIIDEVYKLNNLVNDMTDLSKFTSKIAVLNKEVFCLSDSVKSIVSRYEKISLDFNRFKVFIDADLYVNADRLRIEQVLYNFITNAIKYSNENSMIDIIVKRENKIAKVIVKDYGIGLKQEEVDIVWDRYYRTDKAHQRTDNGSGLGLAIVKEILEHHGFEYGVSSEYGKGSSFWFNIPINED